MLGHVAARFLRTRGHEVSTCDARYRGGPDDPLIEAVRRSECNWIVNAIGRIHQKCGDPSEFLLANAVLPAHLRVGLRRDQCVIHASTDCVFSGQRGNYRVDDERDAGDPYGWSKLLGEAAVTPGKFIAIRASVIGPETNSGYGLMAWFLKQPAGVRGFTNHFWNGVTTLEWAKICDALMEGRLTPASGVVQPGIVPAISKYELLRTIGEVWPHPIAIIPTETPVRVDRTLVPDPVCPPLVEQLRELREWYSAPGINSP